MQLALNWIFEKRRDRILICVWIVLSLLFLSGLLFAWLNGLRYRTFVYWLAFLLLFVDPSATLYLRAGHYDDDHEGKGCRVAVALFSTILGIILFLAMSALLPVREATSEDGYVEVSWHGEGFLVESRKTYAKSELLFFMRDVELEDANRRNFKISPLFFLP